MQPGNPGQENLQMKRTIGIFLLGVATSAATIFMFFGAGLKAQDKLDARAQLCYDWERYVIFGGKADDAPKYVTNDFKEHNVNLASSGIQDYMATLKAHAAALARPGFTLRPPEIVFSHDDVVVFVRPRPDQDDPKNPGKKIAGGTHFDVWRIRGGKLAEHWD
jgi:predicted SnoaL-like aldol condensation-catalyzing enzyme